MLLCKKIKIKVKPSDAVLLEQQADLCRRLYNVALEQRIIAYKHCRKSISVYDQKKELPILKKELLEFGVVYNKCLGATLFRLDKAFKGFFRRLKTGDKPGFPRFKGKQHFFTLEYPAMYIKVKGKTLILPTAGKLPVIKAKLTELAPEKFTTVYITRNSTGNFYASFGYEVTEHKRLNDGILAIDLGIKTLATCVNDNGRFYSIGGFKGYRWFNKQLDKVRSKRDRCKKHSRRWCFLTKIYQRVSEKKQNKLKDSLHKASHLICCKLAEKAVVIGDLSQSQMVAKSENKRLNRAVQNDWGLYKFVQQLEYKTKLYGKTLHKINERYTSKTCSKCSHIQDMPLYKRTYHCPNCGLKMDRDQNSAVNILNRFVAWLEPHIA